MATKKSSKKRVSGSAAATGAAAALAAAAAGAAAGYYFYGTKNARKHRQAASTWAKGMKRDVEKGVKTLKKVDAKTVARIVDDAASAYQGVRGVAADDVRMAAKELKSNWHLIQRDLAPSAAVKKAVTKAKKVVKKAVKTAAKSAPKKKTATKK